MCPEKQPPKLEAGGPDDTKETPKHKRDTAYPLLPLLPEASMEPLRQLGPALERTLPLKPKHREDLPQAVRDLSAQLTKERSGLVGGYLQTPRTLAAYAYYFLPWNVYRQARIFAGQWLRLHSGARILDLGAGPLTSVLALWAARPDLRDKQLTFTCVDRARKAVRLGQDLFRELGGAWRVEVVDQNLEMYLRQQGPQADLVLLGNVLNELRWSNFEPLEQSVAELADKVLQRLNRKKQGRVLVVEPGTRFGGRLAELFRKACLEKGLSVLSPCTHQQDCPMLESRGQSWCHFRFEAAGLPQWLEELSEQAKLPKETLAVSFAHLASAQAKHEDTARVLSNRIRLPGRESEGFYACAKEGLLLLETNRATLEQGELTAYERQPGAQRDRKSGALFAQLPGERGFEPRKDRPGGRNTSGKHPASRKPGPRKTQQGGKPRASGGSGTSGGSGSKDSSRPSRPSRPSRKKGGAGEKE